TTFSVRVISQKELFERTAKSAQNPFATSQNLLALVDRALEGSEEGESARSFESSLEEARTSWMSASRHAESERAATENLPNVKARIAELNAQVAVFDSEESLVRRRRNDRLRGEM